MSNSHGPNDDRSPSPKSGVRLSDEAVSAIRKTVIDGPTPINRGERGRFRKGLSGNPKGRPPRKTEPDLAIHQQPTKALLLEELGRSIQVRENNRAIEMPVSQALIRAEIASALKGNAYAQRHLHDRVERLEREEALEIARQNEVFETYQAQCRAEIEAAKQRGAPLPDPIPHPDDIVIEAGKRVRFIGPADGAEAAKIKRECRLRDVLLMQDALDNRLYVPSAKNGPDDRPGSALIFAHIYNLTLPPRLRLTETQMVMAMMRHDGTAKRVLLRELYQAWKHLGHPQKRGYTFPPARVAEAKIRLAVDFVDTIKQQGRRPADLSLEEITEIFEELLARQDSSHAG